MPQKVDRSGYRTRKLHLADKGKGSEFGVSLDDLTKADLSTEDPVFQIGLPPSRIDILTSISGVDFESAWLNKIQFEFEGTRVYCIGKRELIENKRATGRPRDLADVAALEETE